MLGLIEVNSDGVISYMRVKTTPEHRYLTANTFSLEIMTHAAIVRPDITLLAIAAGLTKVKVLLGCT